MKAVGWPSGEVAAREVFESAVAVQTTFYDLLAVPFQVRRNVEGSTIGGVELDLAARPSFNWSVAAGLAFNTAELEGDFATIARGPRFVYAEDGCRSFLLARSRPKGTRLLGKHKDALTASHDRRTWYAWRCNCPKPWSWIDGDRRKVTKAQPC